MNKNLPNEVDAKLANARAEVARLEALQNERLITNQEWDEITRKVDAVYGALGMRINPNRYNGHESSTLNAVRREFEHVQQQIKGTQADPEKVSGATDHAAIKADDARTGEEARG